MFDIDRWNDVNEKSGAKSQFIAMRAPFLAIALHPARRLHRASARLEAARARVCARTRA
jgi:hypothetical protein